jgi:hypothetical protein
MLTDGLSHKRLRIAALVLGILAATAMIIVGCTSVTKGSPSIDKADAPVYRASVSESMVESAESSSSRESERQASLTTQAITSCEALSSSSVDAITAVNNTSTPLIGTPPMRVPRPVPPSTRSTTALIWSHAACPTRLPRTCAMR